MAEEKGGQAAGENKGRKPWTLRELGGKPVWEWMQLLIVPLALAIIGLLFEMQQAERQRALEEQQAALEDRRAKAERELAEQRAQDEALQAYLDQMGGLLLEKDLRTSEDPSEVRTLARARTATVIQRLDSDRNRDVIRFLKEAGLLTSKEQSSFRILAGEDLQGAHLEVTDLSGANLSGANLSDANLSNANLFRANLNDAYLFDANLKNAYLRGADLSSATLRGADLTNADLQEADLSGANLIFAELPRADLRRANLRGAKGITNEELEQQAASLEGATMPDGQKYEDWVTSKGRAEESSGSS